MEQIDLNEIRARWRERVAGDFREMERSMAMLDLYAHESGSNAVIKLAYEIGFIILSIVGETPPIEQIDERWHEMASGLFTSLSAEVGAFQKVAQQSGKAELIKVGDDLHSEMCRLANTYTWRFLLNGMAGELCK